MVMSKEELSSIELADGELIEISRKKVVKEPMPPWNMVGNRIRSESNQIRLICGLDCFDPPKTLEESTN